ncbi:MAG TPA: 4-hydroxy-tetrahydrodipicolinate synthase [Bacteroidia bacterium]|nr:4-hydroxy-tetrahydrodipicolinate synthase [Bacteroidia bacterium]
MNKFSGTGVALVTPFLKSGKTDFDALRKVVNHVIKGGVDYLVVMGTTGESVTLSKEEKKDILKFIGEVNKKRTHIVFGVGGNNTLETARELEHINDQMADAILSVSPYYNKPNQSGIVQHYKTLSGASQLPIILYNVPGRTGSNLLPQTTLEIASSCKNIIGIKEASGNMEQIMYLIHHRNKGFLVISGDDAITMPLIASGADGVISVIANAYPKQFSTMVRLALQGKMVESRKLHYQLLDLIPLLFAEGSPSGIKYVLSQMGICQNYFRLPVAPVSKTLAQKIDKVIKEI